MSSTPHYINLPQSTTPYGKDVVGQEGLQNKGLLYRKTDLKPWLKCCDLNIC